MPARGAGESPGSAATATAASESAISQPAGTGGRPGAPTAQPSAPPAAAPPPAQAQPPCPVPDCRQRAGRAPGESQPTATAQRRGRAPAAAPGALATARPPGQGRSGRPRQERTRTFDLTPRLIAAGHSMRMSSMIRPTRWQRGTAAGLADVVGDVQVDAGAGRGGGQVDVHERAPAGKARGGWWRSSRWQRSGRPSGRFRHRRPPPGAPWR